MTKVAASNGRVTCKQDYLGGGGGGGACYPKSYNS